MNGKYPPLNALEDHSHGVVYGSNPSQECQGLDNTNNISAHHEEGTTDVNYREKSSNSSNSIWPHMPWQKEPDKMRDNQTTGDAASYTFCSSKTFSPNCQGIPSGMAGDPGNYSYYPGNPQHPTSSNMGHEVEDDTNTSHIKVQDKNQDQQSMDSFVSVDDLWPNGHEKYKTGQMKHNQDSSVIVLSGGTKISSDGSNRGVQLMEVNSLTDVSSVTDEVLEGAASRTFGQDDIIGTPSSEQHLSAEQKEDSGLTVVSSFLNTSPTTPHRKEQPESLVCAHLTQKPKKHAKAYDGRLFGNDCSEASNTKHHRGFLGSCQNLKIDSLNSVSAEPSSACSSTSVNKLESLVNNLYSDIPPTSTLKSPESTQLQTGNRNEPAVKCKAPNLPQRHDGSVKMTSNVECTTTKGATSTCNIVQSKTIVPTEVQMNASSVPKTLKKTKKSRRRYIKKNTIAFTIAQTNLHNSVIPQGMNQTPDLAHASISKTLNEQRFEQEGKSVKEKVKTSQEIKKHNSTKADSCLSIHKTSPIELQNTLQPVSDIKSRPEEVKDYLKKLQHRGESTSLKQSDQNVKLEPDILPHGKFYVTDCENVPLEDHPPKCVEHDQNMDCLKITKACTKKRKRRSRSFKKRKQRKITTLFSVVLETSENTSAQDLQEISQNNAPRNVVTMDLRSKNSLSTKQNDSSTSVQTCSSISLVSSDCKKQTVLSHSVATVDTVETENLTSDVFKRAQKRSPGKPLKKPRKFTQLGASPGCPAFTYEAGKQQCRKNVTVGGLESAISEQRILKPQVLLTSAKKQGKKSKVQIQNVQCTKWSMRHSRRLSKYTLGSVKRLRKDCAATDDTISVKSQSALSQPVHKKGHRKPRKLSKKKTGKRKSNTSFPESSSDVTNISHLTQERTSEDSSLVHCTLRSHHLKMSMKSDLQVATCISPRRRKLNPDVITWDHALVTDTKPLENGSCAVTVNSTAERLEEKRVQMRQDLKKTPLLTEYEENPGVKTKFKTKRKLSEGNTRPVSKRKLTSRQQAMCLKQEQSKTDQLLDCSQCPLKTEVPDDKDTHMDNNKMLTRAAVEKVQFALSTSVSTKESKDKDVKKWECKASWDKKERKTAFELALESFIMTTRFYSSENDVGCDKKLKEEGAENPVMESVNAGTLHSLSRLKVLSEDSESLGNSENRSEDYMASLSKGTRIVDNAIKNEKVKSLSVGDSTKKCIVCKYCGQYFRHLSAYTIHQRIHTGEKPYRCRLCGKNFAQFSKLKFHRKTHTQNVGLCCPCCSKTFSNKNSLVAHFKIHFQKSKNNNRLSQDIQCKLPNTSLDVSDLGKPQKDTSLICKTCDVSNSFSLKSCIHTDHLSCKNCGKKFENSSHLLVHERTHWPVKPYACSICAKGFSQLKALKKHSLEHAGETPFSCSHCSHAFHDLSALRVHQVSVECSTKGELKGDNCDLKGFLIRQGVDGQVNTPVFFKCKICRQLFQKWCQYTLHLQTHTKFPPYICFACGQSYENISEVSVHCKVCCRSSGEEGACGASLFEIFDSHIQNDSPSQSISRLSPCSLQTSKNKTIPVSDGGKSNKNSQTPSSSPSPSKEHLPLQTSEVMDASSSTLHEMGQSPEDVAQLPSAVNHLHSAPPSPTLSAITCVSSNDSLECTEISPSLWRFECLRCGERFKRYRNLGTHMQTHAPGFRYVCGHCGHTFKRWNKLWLHQRIHGWKGRCYSCSQCSLQFRFFGSYKNHMLNHAGERPFACPLCPETFVCEKGLHAHQCEFHKPSKGLQCDVCAKMFSNLHNLLKHSRLHNGAVSHQCLSCKMSFTNNKILQEHLKMHSNSFGLPLPDIPSEPLAFPHKCKRCKASFSSGDLLYAHQACHFRNQAFSIHINEPPLSTSREEPHTETPPLPSTIRPLISTLNLDAIPNDKRLYTYSHPDKLYTMPTLSGRIRLRIINLDSDNEEAPLPVSTASAQALPSSSTFVSGHSVQTIPESTQTSSETDIAHLPQGLESPESTPVQSQPDDCMPPDCTITRNVEEQPMYNSMAQTSHFVETDILLEDPVTFANPEEYGELNESFECPECSYKTCNLLQLHEHCFLRALGNGCLPS